MTTYLGRIQLLSKTSTAWVSSNPVLLAGEFGIADATTEHPVLKVGDGARPWTALPELGGDSQDYVAGYVTTGAAGTPAQVIIDNEADPPTISFVIPKGDKGNTGPVGPQGIQGVQGPIGPVGPPNSLAIGTVTTGAPGSPADATITGTPPNQTLSLTIPAGVQGPQGPIGATGPANSLAIGTVTTGAPGSAADATITGTPPAQTLSLTIPAGVQGPQGIQGIQGPPGSIALADPTASVGLVVIPGSSAFAMRADAAPALSQAIVPTWTGTHIFAGVTNNHITSGVGIGMEAGIPALTFGNAAGGADAKAWDITFAPAQFNIRAINDAVNAARNVMAADRAGFAITNIAFGNATDNPTYTFLGTGTSAFTGRVNITFADAALIATTTTGVTSIIAGSNHVNGSLISFRRSGVPFGSVGNTAALVAGTVPIDGMAIQTAGATPIIFAINAGTEVARFTSGGDLQITGTYSAGATKRAVPGLTLGVAGSGTLAVIEAINYSTFAYLELKLSCGFLNITDNLGTGGDIRIAGARAVTSYADGLLRLNSDNGFASGIYTPGAIRADQGFATDTGGFKAVTGSCALFANRSGTGMTFGSVYAQGAVGGYSGYSINDPLYSYFMSNGSTTYGLYSSGQGKWLIRSDSASAGATDYTLTAPGFVTSSTRAIKRETGTPFRVGDILARLRPILYRLLADDSREQLGLIAEEVHEVCPQLSDGNTVSYDRLALLLLAEWQESHGIALA